MARLHGGVVTCPECGSPVPDVDAPVHALVPAAPGCWSAFTAVQQENLQRLGQARAHGTIVDAYLAQHPGDGNGDPRARRSAVLHLMGLCGRLEHGLADGAVRLLLQRTAGPIRRAEVAALAPRHDLGAITVLDLVAALESATDADGCFTLARRWAEEVWRTWTHEHARIREMYRLAWEG
jgi:hypothetical protein